MSDKPSAKNASDIRNGVPLGGIGTGSIEMGRDGRARNITINNNRTAATRIGLSPNFFTSIRVEAGDKTYRRTLQSTTGIPFEDAGVDPRYTPEEYIGWHGLYPTSNYKFRGEVLPIPFQWTALAPMIPYDNEASNMPLMLNVFKFKNTNDFPIKVAAMVNWENLRGCFSDSTTDFRGEIHPVYITDIDEYLHAHDQLSRAEISESLGLSFGLNEECATTYEGNYCLAAVNQEGVKVTHLGWDANNPDDVRDLWNSFSERATLPNRCSTTETAHQGAVCASTTLAPGDHIGLIFCLSWYFPIYSIGNEDVGNYYTRQFANALEVNEQGLKHGTYFQEAVLSFHERFLKSSLPEWYSRMLLNNTHVLSTNTILTRQNEFAMMESPADPTFGVLDRSFYSSIGTMLFFPGFADSELKLLSNTEATKTPGRVYRDLGKNSVRHPGYGGGSVEMIDLNAKFILLSYRNFHMTGKYASLMQIHPRLKQAIEYAMQLDRDGDGIPDCAGDSTTFQGWGMYGLTSYTAGIWIAAMVAYADLTRELKHEEEARFYEDKAKKALAHLEKRLWVEEQGYYRLYHDAQLVREDHPLSSEACHSGQLCGAWVADFLKLGGWFPHKRVMQALEAIDKINRRDHGYTKGSLPDGSTPTNQEHLGTDTQAEKAWPSFDSVYLACTHIGYGNVAKGMGILRSHYQNIHIKNDYQFNQPLSWNPDTNQPAGWKHDHHMGALSVWHSLYALIGFFLSVPRKAISIAPQLPEGVQRIEMPLVTPVSFGRLKYERTEKPYKQQVLITFDSPLAIKIIQLSIPSRITQPVVALKLDSVTSAFQIQVKPNQTYNELNIHLTSVLQVQHPIYITVTES